MLYNKMKLIVKPIPVPKGFIHPPPKNDILPSHEFTMGIIGKNNTNFKRQREVEKFFMI
jgi:hypothetical protein